ncbi:unnamed protein product [marine sediment metagenome]|uniref:Methyltransferase type 11 domain-containing protein n=1 Tax=marine sediment metagenome TaxID=412755 RepID=X1BCS0_9ZZZZ
MKSRNFEERTAQFLRECGISGKSALDIGARYSPEYGAGLFAGLQEFGVEDYTILEIFNGYVKELKEHDYSVVQGDVRQIQRYFLPESFDIVCWVHGPEHLNNFTEICESIDKLKRLTKQWLIISFPIGEEKQGAIDGNPYQRHRYTIPSVQKILDCFNKKDNVRYTAYKRLPRKTGHYTTKFNPNAVIVYEGRLQNLDKRTEIKTSS